MLSELPYNLPDEIRHSISRIRRRKMDRLDLRLVRNQGAEEKQIQVFLRPFSHGTMVLLEDSTDASRAAFLRTWAEGIGRIVHAFKSPASTIRLNLRQFRQKNPSPETLDRIEGQSELLLRYTHQFKKVFSLLEMNPEVLEINQLMRRILVHYQGAYGDQIRFEAEYSSEPLNVRADRDQMETMFRCLLDNSVEALEGEGRIQIRLGIAEGISGKGKDWVERYAEVDISDNGRGMDAQTLELALKPGISTKEQGMGLGLPQAKLIAELHGGEFDIRSQLGIGTSVHIRLPLLTS